MSVYSFVCSLTFLLYLEMCVFLVFKNRKEVTRILLSCSCVCLAVSSFCQAFIYSAPDKETCFRLYHLYSPFVFVSICIFIHFAVVFANGTNRLRKVIPLFYVPAVVFGIKGIFGTNMIRDFELRGGTWFEIPKSPDIWTAVYSLFYFSYALVSIGMIIRWGLRSEILKVKKQASLIVCGFLISFTLNVFINYIQPLVFSPPIMPRISSSAYLFLLLSLWYSMFKFDFLGNTQSTIEKSPLWKKLSSRERMIVPLLYDGLTYKEAAFRLSISEGTLRKHMENIYRKTGINNRTKLITTFYDFGAGKVASDRGGRTLESR